jgi:hypothetical protein
MGCVFDYLFMDLFIILIAYSSVESIFPVLYSNYWYNGDHGGDGVLDRTHSGTGVVIDLALTLTTTERHLFHVTRGSLVYIEHL